MLGLVKETIDRIYVNHDHEYFLEKCRAEPVLPEDLWKVINAQKASVVIKHAPRDFFPSIQLILEYEQEKKAEFEAVFKTKLLISKIAPVFYIEHEAEVKNLAKDALIVTLKGSIIESTMEQFDFSQQVIEVLEKFEYTCLSYREMIEVVFGLSLADEKQMSQHQITVESAIFADLLCLCFNGE
jgi:hypothetical protein